MHDLSPFVDRELDEHRQLQQVIADRIEVLERIGSLARQLDALTHRALAPATDLQTEAIAAGHRASLVAAAAKAATAKPPARAKASTAKAKPAKTAKAAKPKATGPARPRRSPAESESDDEAAKATSAKRATAVPIKQVQDEVLAFLGSRDLTDPASATMIAEGIGRERYCVDKAIAACNGALAQVVERRGPKPALYLRSDQLPAECWPHTANEARAQSVPEWIKQLEDARDGTIKRRGEGVRAKGAIIRDVDPPGGAADQAEQAQAAREAEQAQEQAARIEQAAEATRRAEEEAAFAEREAERAAGLTTAPTVPPVSPRVARELAREGETAGDHQDVQPDNLSGRVLRTLQDNGGMRVRDIADQLKEDPPVIAKVVSDHIKSGNIRKNSHDGTYYAVGQMATA